MTMQFKIDFKLYLLTVLAVEVVADYNVTAKQSYYIASKIKTQIKTCLISAGDLPCVPISKNQSVVCLCTATYCDTITRIDPDSGTYIAYTSSKLGLRFSKSQGYIEAIDSNYDDGDYGRVFELRPNKYYQIIEGFGGAATDSAGINWQKMHPAIQEHLINSYFSDEGLEYNMLRLPIGSTDFSPRFYTYNDYPKDDKFLTNFTLAPEDIKFKIPLIKACLDAATARVDIVAAAWSSPTWMSTREPISGISFIKDEYFQSYADYHCKFAELYKQEGIHIWGISTGNEPLINIEAGVIKETTAWNSPNMAKFISKHFGPTIRNCTVKDIKVLAVDDQRYTIPLYFTSLKEFDSNAMNYIDGIAVHFYGDNDTPASIITQALKNYPKKFAIGTEACAGIGRGKENVVLGSWDRAKEYFMDILEDLNYNVVGWIDWNLFLDKQGGPNWVHNFVDSPIIIDVGKQEFYKQPTFYALGHFSKFVPRGSQRIKVVTLVPAADPDLDFSRYFNAVVDTRDHGACNSIEISGANNNKNITWIDITSAGAIDNVAFITPKGTIIVVIYNEGSSQNCAIQLGDLQATVFLEEDSIITVEMAFDGNSLGSLTPLSK